MILIDTNLLVYATHDGPHHDAANKWLDDTLWSSGRVALPWQALLGFVRIATNRRLFARPMPMARAWEQVDEWLAQESVWSPGPTERHLTVLRGLFKDSGVTDPNAVPDAHLAALSIEHGLEVCTLDAGFARFPGVRWRNPLA